MRCCEAYFRLPLRKQVLRQPWQAGIFLGLLTALCYFQTLSFDFVNYDDGVFVYENPHVTRGLTVENVQWAFTTSFVDFWHPLTWISHMAVCEAFALEPGWHHLFNILLHAGSATLLFSILVRLTKKVGRSAICAALFALHPMHVESVAWISERKDTLSGFFFFLSIWAYIRYADRRHRGRECGASKTGCWYALTLLFFVSGLMSKAMVVTLPCILLLLDLWPLNRISFSNLTRSASKVILEKAPLLLLSIGSCVITYRGMRAAGNLKTEAEVPWGSRLATIPLAYIRYLEKLFWPRALAAHYPMARHYSVLPAVACLILLVSITVVVLYSSRSRPWLTVGWFWFVGMLVPVIGVVPNGLQFTADRYTYLPAVGLFLVVVWEASNLFASTAALKNCASLSGLAVIGVSAVLSWHQIRYWKNSYALWERCLSVAPDSYTAQYNYGVTLRKAGRSEEALPYLTKALQFKPEFDEAENVGVAYAMAGRLPDATNYFTMALRLNPDYVKAHEDLAQALLSLADFKGAESHYGAALSTTTNKLQDLVGLGCALSGQGRRREAILYFEKAGELDAFRPEIPYLLGVELTREKKINAAIGQLRKAINLRPDFGDAHFQLAVALSATGQLREAIDEYHHVLRVNSKSVPALNNLAWILATNPDPTLRSGPEAVSLAREGCELTGFSEVMLMGTLSAAYAEAAEFSKAIETSEKAIDLANAEGQNEAAERNREMLSKFEQRQPWRESLSR